MDDHLRRARQSSGRWEIQLVSRAKLFTIWTSYGTRTLHFYCGSKGNNSAPGKQVPPTSGPNSLVWDDLMGLGMLKGIPKH